jgi:hypothetical protein
VAGPARLEPWVWTLDSAAFRWQRRLGVANRRQASHASLRESRVSEGGFAAKFRVSVPTAAPAA